MTYVLKCLTVSRSVGLCYFCCVAIWLGGCCCLVVPRPIISFEATKRKTPALWRPPAPRRRRNDIFRWLCCSRSVSHSTDSRWHEPCCWWWWWWYDPWWCQHCRSFPDTDVELGGVYGTSHLCNKWGYLQFSNRFVLYLWRLARRWRREYQFWQGWLLLKQPASAMSSGVWQRARCEWHRR